MTKKQKPTELIEFASEIRKEHNTKIIKFEKGTSDFFDGGTFLHDEFAQYMLQRYKFTILDGDALHYFEDTHYVYVDMNKFRRILVDEIPIIKENQRKEVFYSLMARAKQGHRSSPRYIAMKNGVFDVETMQLDKNHSNYVITNYVNITYDKEAYSKDLNRFLNEISNHDKDIRKLLEESVGYGLYASTFMQKCFILYAPGSNGKSTWFSLLYQFFGEDNITPLSLQDTQHEFKLFGLLNKMVAIGDDISATRIEEAENFKKLVTGDPIYCNRKYQDPLSLKNYATLMYSSNQLPNIKDTTHGLYRRLIIIPFMNTFSKEKGNLDLSINEKLDNHIVRSHLFNLAIEGLQRVMEHKQFTEPEAVKKALQDYQKENNIVVEFVEDIGINKVVDQDKTEVFEQFKWWLERNGLKSKSAKYLTNELNKVYGLEVKQSSKRVNGIPRNIRVYRESK